MYIPIQSFKLSSPVVTGEHGVSGVRITVYSVHFQAALSSPIVTGELGVTGVRVTVVYTHKPSFKLH